MKNKRAFTFIELMLAIGIFSVIAVVIYSTFNAGLSAWKNVQKTQEVYHEMRLALGEIEKDFENAVLYLDESKDEEVQNFIGEQYKISFYTVRETFESLRGYPQLKKVSYIFDSSTNTLKRGEDTYREIAANLNDLRFSYCSIDEDTGDISEWQNSWEWPEIIPLAVKIDFELGIEKDRTFTKYVFIPTGRNIEKQ